MSNGEQLPGLCPGQACVLLLWGIVLRSRRSAKRLHCFGRCLANQVLCGSLHVSLGYFLPDVSALQALHSCPSAFPQMEQRLQILLAPPLGSHTGAPSGWSLPIVSCLFLTDHTWYCTNTEVNLSFQEGTRSWSEASSVPATLVLISKH